MTESPAPTPAQGTRAFPWRPVLLGVVVVVLIGAGALLPVKAHLVRFLRWTEGLGLWGPVLVAAFYIPACVFFLPGSVLTLGAGALFGIAQGTVAVSAGSTLGACAAFLAGRGFARQWVAGKVAGRPTFAAIDHAVGKNGFRIVLLTRLSPVFPFNLLNYLYGVTNVRFKDYALASWIGMLPGTVMYVYLGSAAGSLTRVAAGEVQRSPGQRVFFWVGLLVAVVVTVMVTRLARQALAEAVPTAAGDAS